MFLLQKFVVKVFSEEDKLDNTGLGKTKESVPAKACEKDRVCATLVPGWSEACFGPSTLV